MSQLETEPTATQAQTHLPRQTRRPTVVVQPTHGLATLNLRELWAFRDLLIILAGRDVKLRYKQTALGVIWVVLQPLVAALTFAVIFGGFAKLPSDGSPYVLFVFCGMLPWNLFAGALQRAGNSLIGNSNLISKVYFPRVIIPIASAASVLIDFAVSLIVLFVLMLIYQVMPTWQLVALPFFLLLTLLAATGVSLWLSGLNVYYRDFSYALPFLVQVWLYASPVAYATTIVPEQWRALFSLNPAVAFIEGFRWAILGQSALTIEMIVSATLVSLMFFASGLYVFRRIERGFADVL
ncbi:MAG: ABC transporter permease [Chloroflexi bacterium]|nr:ABC transporter permease [Chloroflexota bacterium]